MQALAVKAGHVAHDIDEAMALHQALGHPEMPLMYPYLARRIRHELRAGHVSAAQALVAQYKVRQPAPGQSTRRHTEQTVLRGEVAAAAQDWANADTLAAQALQSVAVFSQPLYASDLAAQAWALKARVLLARGDRAGAQAATARATEMQQRMADSAPPQAE